MSYQERTESIIRNMREDKKEMIIEQVALIVSETKEGVDDSYSKEQAFDRIVEVLNQESVFEK